MTRSEGTGSGEQAGADIPLESESDVVDELLSQIHKRNIRLSLLRQESEALGAQKTQLEQQLQALMDQVGEREQQVQALTEQVAEREQQLQALTEQVAEREQQVQALTEQARTNQYRSKLLEEKDQLIDELTERLDARERSFSDLAAKLEEKERLIEELAEQLREESRLANELANQVEEGERELQVLQDKLSSIQTSVSWWLIQPLSRLRSYLMPDGSRRAAGWLGLKKAWSDLRAEGLRSALMHAKKDTRRERREREQGRSFSDDSASGVDTYQGVEYLVSIIIPVFNGVSLTKPCVRSIYVAETQIPFEVIVVDNGSTDGTVEWLKSQANQRNNFRYLEMGRNLGFSEAVNRGVRESRSKYVVILNNDTRVTNGWLDRLADVFTIDPSVGIASPVTNFVGEGAQLDRDALEIDITEIDEYASHIKKRDDLVYEPNRLVFFCVMLRRALFDIVGELDSGYDQGNFEDDDYCLRTRVAGYKLAISLNAFVYHHGSATFQLNQISHADLMNRNRMRFFTKAGRIAAGYPPGRRRLPASDPDVSIIIRTVNKPKALRNAINSLANQTYSQFEVVILNDGGPDIADLVGEFAKILRIAYFRHDVPKGRSHALNSGVRMANGRWITYLDEDDILYPWYLEAFISSIHEFPEHQAFYCDYNKSLMVEESSSTPLIIQGVTPWEFDREELLCTNYIPIHCWMHSKEVYEQIGGYDNDLERLEDYDFILRASSYFELQHIDKAASEYRFYLDKLNSIAVDRLKTKDALTDIYDRNPVAEERLLLRRRRIIEAIEDQAKIIGGLLDSRASERQEDEGRRINREVIKIVAGI